MTETCKHGHPRTDENVYVDKRGFRTCRVCARERMRSRKSTETRKNFRCEKCGKAIWVQPSLLSRRRFCSYECRWQTEGEIEKARDRRGSKNPNFKHGLKAGQQIRGWGVLFKGEDCCRVCGSTDNLHLHHVIPRGLGTEESRRDLRNGITLCGSCHTLWHRHSLIITRDLFTEDEWDYISSVRMTGRETDAWLEDRYPTV